MRKSVTLNKRSTGPWANFETFLIKDEHTGFIDWRGPNVFRLKKTPFSNHYSNFLYVVPTSTKNIPEQGLIRVKTGELHRDIHLPHNTTYGNYVNKAYIVEGYELLNVDSLPKPNISKEEFLHFITEEWVGSDDYPLFKKEVAYNLLSCQKDFFGTGGIGVETFAPMGNRQTMKFLKSTISGLLPEDFKKHNDVFQYNFIQKEGDIQITNERRNDPRSNEVSFNDMSSLPAKKDITTLNIQIPLVLPSDLPHKVVTYQNPDILDYQLRSLLIKPTIEPKLHEKFTDLAIDVSVYVDKNYSEETLRLDALSLIKIACASCRLEMKNKLDEDMLPRVKGELLDIFKDYADTYQDRMTGGGLARWNIPMQPMPQRYNLTIDANKVYKEVLTMDKQMREIGINWITSEELRKNPNISYLNDFTFQKSLIELNNASLLIQRKNYSELSVVHYEE